MRDLSKLEMINTMAEVMLTCEIEDQEELTFEDAVRELESDEIQYYTIEKGLKWN